MYHEDRCHVNILLTCIAGAALANASQSTVEQQQRMTRQRNQPYRLLTGMKDASNSSHFILIGNNKRIADGLRRSCKLRTKVNGLKVAMEISLT